MTSLWTIATVRIGAAATTPSLPLPAKNLK